MHRRLEADAYRQSHASCQRPADVSAYRPVNAPEHNGRSIATISITIPVVTPETSITDHWSQTARNIQRQRQKNARIFQADIVVFLSENEK